MFNLKIGKKIKKKKERKGRMKVSLRTDKMDDLT